MKLIRNSSYDVNIFNQRIFIKILAYKTLGVVGVEGDYRQIHNDKNDG